VDILLINHYSGSLRHGMEFRPGYLRGDGANSAIAAGAAVPIRPKAFPSQSASHGARQAAHRSQLHRSGRIYLVVRTALFLICNSASAPWNAGG
jgi:hypothetical protein